MVSQYLPMEAAIQTPKVIKTGGQGSGAGGSDLLPWDHQLHDFVMTVSFSKPLGLGMKPGHNIPLPHLQ